VADPSVVLLTAAQPNLDDETSLLITALADARVSAAMRPWTASVPDCDLVVIRSTWDYTAQPAAFLAAVTAIAAPVWNPVEVVQWNSHKGYLLELAAAGVPVVPTTLVRPTEAVSWPDGPLVIKPAISADAMGTRRFDSAGPDAVQHLRVVLTGGDALIQPFVPEVTAGELSLVYLDGAYSHAVRKVPADGDYRVQYNHGGRVEQATATQAQRDVADAALAVVPAELLYARIDLIETASGPQLMELELIEPYLYLRDCPGSESSLAAAILRRLG
jgi:glutathione synthase/RimK-type ligase-like ATP-grasp enzyme